MAAGSIPRDRTSVIHHRTDEPLVEQHTISDGQAGNLLGIFGILYRAGSRRRVGFDGADWWSRRVGCYLVRDGHMAEEKR
jgi:hypothetical protein